ncbi:MAG: nucleotidyltransferase [Nanoarchaeota archaeon]|nr:nucleotidyltransferase [Nanoarchaeota archaeon]
MNEEFKQEQLEEILKHIAQFLVRPTKIFLFGGAVMVYNNLKPSTKDIDILLENKQDYEHFIEAAKRAGFISKQIPLEYYHFDLSIMLQNPKTEWRLDIFFKKVCKKFCFNLNVKERSKLFTEINNLKIYFISFEDIFLMKSLTQRERDLEDMNTILGFGLDFKAINHEIENQKEHKWDILERLFEFEEKYNLKLDLSAKTRKAFQEYFEEKIKRILKKQVKVMLKEGKSKERIRDHFKLTEAEWKKLIQKES